MLIISILVYSSQHDAEVIVVLSVSDTRWFQGWGMSCVTPDQIHVINVVGLGGAGDLRQSVGQHEDTKTCIGNRFDSAKVCEKRRVARDRWIVGVKRLCLTTRTIDAVIPCFAPLKCKQLGLAREIRSSGRGVVLVIQGRV